VNRPRPLDAEAFRTPNRDFGILPFWFLNGELDPDEMRLQLRELRDKGMHGVVFHGRYGLEMPYLGEKYLDRIRLGVEEANRLGLKAWIYDEMNWPSGTADKRVLKGRPDLAQRYLECVSFQITGPWFMCLTGEDSRYLDFQRSTPVAAYAIGEDGRVVDLTPNLSFEKVVPWEVPPGAWRLCYLVEKRADYYIDALDPESTAEFLRVGYAPYLDALGNGARDEEGRSVVGFYSDEPAMHYFLTAGDNPIVPWTKDMFRLFMERNGYDLRPRLVDLFFDLDPRAPRTRFDYYSTTTDLYTNAYYRQIRDWCRERGVLFTAHLLYEEWLRQMIRVEGNLFKHYANMDVVAVDHLYPVIGTRQAPDQHVAMKVASSAAHHFGSDRLICESFGGIFMDATMQRMKWIADWEYVLGVNLLNPHGFHYTFEGARKRDWPPSMFYQYPWWHSYGEFSAYISRTSEMLSGGRHVAKVAMIWPINSSFATYLPHVRTPDNDMITAGLNVLTDALLRLHHDFDYIDEDVLAGADISDGKLRVANEEYELVLIPPMTHVKGETLEALERFVRAGGKVVGVVSSPQTAFSDGGLADAAGRMNALIGSGDEASGLVRREHEGGGAGAFLAGDPSVVTGPPGPERDALMAGLGEAIASLIEPDIAISNEELFVLHRRRDGRDLYFVVNTTIDVQPARVSLAGDARPVIWDPSSGAERPVGAVSRADGRTAFDLTFPPVGSAFVMTSEGRESNGDTPVVVGTNLVLDEVTTGSVTAHGSGDDGWVEIETPGGIERLSMQGGPLPAPVVLDGSWTFHTEDDNALVVKSWLAAPEAGVADPEAFAGPDVDESGWQPVVAGAWSLQLPTEPDGPWPVPVWFRVAFDVEDVPERLALLVDGFAGDDPAVILNRDEVTSKAIRSRIDSQMKELDLTEWVQAGRNVLAVRLVVRDRTGGLVDHLKLIGRFAVSGEPGAERIVSPVSDVRPESWAGQGYPYLSGGGTYTSAFDVAELPAGIRWMLEVPMRDDVVEVEVNGQPAGVRLWDPYEVDVTGLLRAGTNDVGLRVSNTPANLLNGVPRPSGLAGPPRLVPTRSFSFAVRAMAPAGDASEGGS
jgi:glycosyl hydrolase family 106( putative alpha-L-rhamnosidase)